MRPPELVAEHISTGIETSDKRNCPFQIGRAAMVHSSLHLFERLNDQPFVP